MSKPKDNSSLDPKLDEIAEKIGELHTTQELCAGKLLYGRLVFEDGTVVDLSGGEGWVLARVEVIEERAFEAVLGRREITTQRLHIKAVPAAIEICSATRDSGTVRAVPRIVEKTDASDGLIVIPQLGNHGKMVALKFQEINEACRPKAKRKLRV